MSWDASDRMTELLRASADGDVKAREALFTLIYDDLRRLARSQRFVGQYGETMQPTVVANEVFLRFEDLVSRHDGLDQSSHGEFFGTVAMAMRSILRDNWRHQNAQKRGGGQRRAHPSELDGVAASSSPFDQLDFAALDDALSKLEDYNNRWFQIVMYRHFAGRSAEETAKLLGIGLTTLKSDWQLARAWLFRAVSGENG